jgi:rhodanese-related sulfurtransferase
MRLLISVSVAGLLALGVLTACNSTDKTVRSAGPVSAPSTAPVPADGARRITIKELTDLLAKDEAVVIDVRNEASYGVGHIKGAKLIPLNEVVDRMDQLPRNKLIVTYCSCAAEHTAAIAVNNLKAKGMENAAALIGGFPAWQSAGLPVATN